MAAPELENLISRLRALLKSRREASFAYLFGSAAKGRAAPDSDLDLAVWIRGRRADLPREKLKLLNIIGSKLGLDRVDLTILNAAPASLRYVVQKEGRLVFERDADSRTAFECRARKDYWDWEPRLRIYAGGMLRRMREGTYGA